jgi:uncharacterized protein YcbK (DUF882 family)
MLKMDFKKNKSNNGIDRRRFLSIGLTTAASALFRLQGLAAASNIFEEDRSLLLFNAHTEEFANITYWSGGDYISKALDEINHIFRDHYDGSIKPIDKRLLDLLFFTREKLESSEPFHLVSGYRSPKTNAILRKKNRSVAKRSLHMDGMAADIRLPGQRLRDLRRAARSFKAGGVGYYPHSRFVHVDVGEVRYWNK